MILQRLLSQVDASSAKSLRSSLASLLTGLTSAIEALRGENQAMAEDCRRLRYDLEVAEIAIDEAQRRLARIQARFDALPRLPDLPDPQEVFAVSSRAVAEARALADSWLREAGPLAGGMEMTNKGPDVPVPGSGDQSPAIVRREPPADDVPATAGPAAALPAREYTTGPVPLVPDAPFDGVDEEDVEVRLEDGPVATIPAGRGSEGRVLPEFVDRAVLFGLASRVGMLDTESLPVVEAPIASPSAPRAAFNELAALIVLLPLAALSIYTVQQAVAGVTAGLLIAYLLVGLIASAIFAPIFGLAGGIENVRARGRAAIAASVIDLESIVLGGALLLANPAWFAPAAAFIVLGLAALAGRVAFSRRA